MSSVLVALKQLPSSGLTVSALQALDRFVPGAWQNTTDLQTLAAEVSGEKASVNAAILARATALSVQPRYQRALQVYQLVDTADQVAAGAAMVNKVTSLFGSLDFLEKFTPKADTTQAIDAGLKLIAEVVAYGFLEGMPTGPGGLKRFAGALEDYARFDLVRIGGWVVFDGLIPLGPDFIAKILGQYTSMASSALTDNPVFSQIAGELPGKTAKEKQGFIIQSLETTADWITRFVAERSLTQKGALNSLQGVLGVADGGLDYVAAAIDASTTYFSHTGTQTVARSLVRHGHAQLRDQIWKGWVDQQP